MKTNQTSISDYPHAQFWELVPDAIHDERTLFHVVGEYLDQFRETIDGSNRTAKAIDRKESWEWMEKCAKEEGYDSFADAIGYIDGIMGDLIV